MFITPAEMVPITSLCTFLATVAAFRVQRFYSRRDAESDHLRDLDSSPRQRARERDESAKIGLLSLFAESERELSLTDDPSQDWTDPFRSARFRRESLWDPSRVDNRIAAEAGQLLPMVLDQELRLHLTVCADVVAHWDDLDTEHGMGAVMQTLVARLCANWAVQAIACALRHEALPAVDSILQKRVCLSGRAERRPYGPVTPKSFTLEDPWILLDLIEAGGGVAINSAEVTSPVEDER